MAGIGTSSRQNARRRPVVTVHSSYSETKLRIEPVDLRAASYHGGNDHQAGIAPDRNLPGWLGGNIRGWGARLCLCADEVQLKDVLVQAVLDMGFAEATVRCGDPHGTDASWTRIDALAVEPDALATLGELESRAATVCGDRAVATADVLTLDRPDSTAAVEPSRDPDSARWQARISTPDHGSGRGVTVRIVSASSHRYFRERLDRIRSLLFLYSAASAKTVAPAGPPAREPELSARQFECLRWAAAGKSYEDIGDILRISERTVRYHLNNVRDLFGFSTVIQAIVHVAKQYDLDPLDPR